MVKFKDAVPNRGSRKYQLSFGSYFTTASVKDILMCKLLSRVLKNNILTGTHVKNITTWPFFRSFAFGRSPYYFDNWSNDKRFNNRRYSLFFSMGIFQKHL